MNHKEPDIITRYFALQKELEAERRLRQKLQAEIVMDADNICENCGEDIKPEHPVNCQKCWNDLLISPSYMVAKFHRLFVAKDQTDAQPAILEEEHRELQEALASGDRIKIAQELSNLVYVCYGTALIYGIDLDAALVIDHQANMSKLGPDGKAVLRDDGKVLKPEGYKPGDFSKALK